MTGLLPCDAADNSVHTCREQRAYYQSNSTSHNERASTTTAIQALADNQYHYDAGSMLSTIREPYTESLCGDNTGSNRNPYAIVAGSHQDAQ